MTFWAEYKVEVAVVLGTLQRVSCHSYYHARSSMSTIRTCSEAPFVRPPLMDVASELHACLVDYHALQWARFALVQKLLSSGLHWWMQPASLVRVLWTTTLFNEHDSHLFRSSFRPASIDGCSQRASCVSCGLPRSSMSMIRTCSEAPFVRPPLMDAASELRACLVVKHTGEKRWLLCIWSVFDVCVCNLCFVYFRSWFNFHCICCRLIKSDSRDVWSGVRNNNLQNNCVNSRNSKSFVKWIALKMLRLVLQLIYTNILLLTFYEKGPKLLCKVSQLQIHL